ncbi:MAG: SMI1/KNR4 family protein [Victivallaceae bacterium]
MQKRIIWILFLSIAAISAFIIILTFPYGMKKYLYPSAPAMPAAVTTPMEQLLKELETEMQAKAPEVLKSFLPGLHDFEIDRLEQLAGAKLPANIRKLYMWRNGQRSAGIAGPIPGHRFLPLQEAVEEKNNQWRKNNDQNRARRILLNSFIKHRKTWLPIFEDISGDGFFYDMARRESRGGVFYCSAEDNTYVFFPSIKNLAASILKCYKNNIFKAVKYENQTALEDEYYQSRTIWLEFGAANKEKL